MLEVARRIAASGLLDFMNVMHAQPADNIGLAINIPNMAFAPAPFLYLASAIKAAVPLPVFHAGKIADLATAARAILEGHVDMVAMTRAHFADPHIVRKLIEGRPEQIRQCVGANYCIDRIYMGGGALCIQNVAMGREATIPHEVAKAARARTIVIAGAGPGGLEAARVARLRGHRVVLFEREARTGGQISLAAKAGWREPLGGIVRWLDSEVRRLGVDVRLGTAATPELIEVENPDVVIVATGGRPNKGDVKGAEHVVTAWDVLAGAVQPGDNVLVFDDHGQHQAASVAEHMAARGAAVEMVTPDRMVAEQMGATNFAIHLRELFKLEVVMTPNLRLVEVGREGNQLVAVLRHEYSGQEEERLVDQVVVEHGTLPVDELYFALRPRSSNLGEVDYEAMVAGKPQTIVNNAAGRFQLFRIGDAVASRNIHAAILDGMRFLKDA
jgi:NADPH-dependent 2,4-dienoyl-CoA reductase/sulfur reductase-like enzyme